MPSDAGRNEGRCLVKMPLGREWVKWDVRNWRFDASTPLAGAAAWSAIAERTAHGRGHDVDAWPPSHFFSQFKRYFFSVLSSFVSSPFYEYGMFDGLCLYSGVS